MEHCCGVFWFSFSWRASSFWIANCSHLYSVFWSFTIPQFSWSILLPFAIFGLSGPSGFHICSSSSPLKFTLPGGIHIQLSHLKVLNLSMSDVEVAFSQRYQALTTNHFKKTFCCLTYEIINISWGSYICVKGRTKFRFPGIEMDTGHVVIGLLLIIFFFIWGVTLYSVPTLIF
jgi:hypothetical protein